MPTIDVNGETIHYTRAGTGPTLAMFHSLGTNSYLWAGQVEQLKDRFTCIAFDARGHGKSTNNGGVTNQAVAEDAHAVLSALGLLPAVIMGISMGGLQCARFYALAPGDVSAIVYADSFSYIGEAGHERVKAIEATLAEKTMAAYAQDYADQTLLPATGDQEKQALIAAISGMTAENYLQMSRSVFTEDVREHLKSINKPMKIVVGDQDNRTLVSASEAVLALVPTADMEIIPGAAHLANIDNPDGFMAAIEPFLARFSG